MITLSTAFSVVLAVSMSLVGVLSTQSSVIVPQGLERPRHLSLHPWYTNPLERYAQAEKEAIERAESTRASAIALVLRHEGGFAHHPGDPGGATSYGITTHTARVHGYKGAMRDFTQADAMRIYADLWDQSGVAQFDGELAIQAFDAYVAHGPRAMRWVQYGYGSCEKINHKRLSVYRNSANWRMFGRGWERRIRANLERCK